MTSPSQARKPVFSGNLCLGSKIVRFAESALSSASSGRADFSPNLAQLPQGVVISFGSTWNFQRWFRDVRPTVRSSRAMSVRFE